MRDDEDHEDDDDDDREDIAAGEEFLFGLNLDSIHAVAATDEDASDKASSAEPPLEPLNDDSEKNSTILKELCLFQQDANRNNSVATQDDFVELFGWASDHGAVLGGMTCQTDSYGGRGLFATRHLGVGEVIAMLPRSLRWGQSYACHQSSLPFLSPSTPDLTALSLLVLQLCRDNHIYAKCLPRQSQFTNALLMSKEEETAWGQIDKQYSDAIQRVRSIGEGCQGYIRHVVLGEGPDTTTKDMTTFSPTVLWAIAIVKSRSHAFGSKRGYWLTPVLDLVNHSVTPNAVLVGGDEGQLLLQALVPIGKGEEVTIDYQVGDDSDAMLLATYGFSLVHKPPIPNSGAVSTPTNIS